MLNYSFSNLIKLMFKGLLDVKQQLIFLNEMFKIIAIVHVINKDGKSGFGVVLKM